MLLNIASDFSDAPGGRYIKEGDFSGELFREYYLIPKIKEAKSLNEKLIINLNDCYGFSTGFLEEAFGGLRMYYSKEEILTVLEFIMNDNPEVVNMIKEYIVSSDRDGYKKVLK